LDISGSSASSFTTLIEKDILHFIRDDRIHFQAKVSASNSAFLLRDTIPLQQLAPLSSISSPMMDLTLWHHRLCHHHFVGIKKLLSGNLVKGLKLDSRADPDLALVVPEDSKLQRDLVELNHDSPTAAHPGIDKTHKLLLRQYWWPC